MEFAAVRRALEVVQQHKPVKVVLGDVPVDTTLRGMWASLSAWQRVKIMASFLWDLARPGGLDIDAETVEKLKDDDMLSLLCAEFAEHFPQMMVPLCHGRNTHLAHSIQCGMQSAVQQQARRRRGGGGVSRVAAVVGKAHVRGIIHALQQGKPLETMQL